MTRLPNRYDSAQALIRSGFGTLDGARYILLNLEEVGAARRWIAEFAPTTLADIQGQRAASVRQLAISHAGLAVLGLSAEDLASFPAEFQLGMASDTIARRLGDLGPDAAEHWQWGAVGDEPHVLAMLFAPKNEIEELEARLLEKAFRCGLVVRASHSSVGSTDHEPFGFRDGVSQPEIEWEGRSSGPRHAYGNALAPGELLLGYPDEYGLLPDSPVAERGGERIDLGLNGSYLVFRRLSQDVKGFWQWLRDTTGDAESAMKVAELMVGRQVDGAPLAGLGEGPNEFTFAGDPDGRLCPVASHIRRCNPRTGDLPNGRRSFFGAIIDMLGFTGTAEGDAIAASRFHRLIRRGRAYGNPLSIAEALDPASQNRPAGLNFICLNTNITRQFEFVQGAWLNSGRFAGLNGQADPVTGSRLPFPDGCPTHSFAYRDADGRLNLLDDIPSFVRVEAGGYFFLPSAEALQSIAALD